jgi:hypothetical protein
MGKVMEYKIRENKVGEFNKFYGRLIVDVDMKEVEQEGGFHEVQTLVITFADNSKIEISDYGQDCCEHRYMTTDDDIKDLIGGVLIKIESKGFSHCIDDKYDDYHEVYFVEVATNKTSITLCTHNIHNGYYGGFDLVVVERSEN